MSVCLAPLIGQDDACRQLGLAAYRFVHARQRGALLMVGPTGCGKTLVATELARVLDRPVVHVNAASLVPTGIVGTCISNVLIRLWEAAGQNVTKAERGVLVFDEIDKLLLGSSHYGQTILSQLLRLVEGADIAIDDDKIAPKLKSLNTSGMLIIFAGAWTQHSAEQNMAQIGFTIGTKPAAVETSQARSAEDLGFAPEMTGRISAIIPIQQHTHKSLLAILRHPHVSPFTALRAHLQRHNSLLIVEDDALECIAHRALSMGTGARALVGIVDCICESIWMRCATESGQVYVIDLAGLRNN